MKTEPIYLVETYKKEMDAQILGIEKEAENKYRIILDKTVFYPMGGGQATDQGFFKSENWVGKIYQVLLKDGEIVHFLDCENEPFVGENVHGEINWDRRYKNMKLHSAGHIIDFAMHILGYSPSLLTPVKADHNKELYILYAGLSGENTDELKKKLEEKSNELIEKKIEMSWGFTSLEELKKEAIYLQPNLPTSKPLRMLKMEGVGAVADGGTIVKNTEEVGKIKIDSILEEDGNTKIIYKVE